MAILLDANPNSLTLGAYDDGPFEHQLQPDLAWYNGNVPRPGGGSWVNTDFLQVASAPWDATQKAWRLTIFPARRANGTTFNERERSELLLIGDRANPANFAYTIFKNWSDDPRDPANFRTIYYANRRTFGDGTFPWIGPIAGGTVLQVKGMGYDDPAVSGTRETMNFQQGPVFEMLARGSDFQADCQGGILTMNFGVVANPPNPDYVPGHRQAYGKFAGALFSSDVFDIVCEVTLSIGRITTKNMTLPGGQVGGFRIWIRNFTRDQSDWNDANHLKFDSFSVPGTGGLDNIPSGQGPRALGAIETWNYQGAAGETYPDPTTHPPVAAAAYRQGYMPPAHFTGRGIYRGGAVNGETATHRTYIGKERICTTLAEAFALYGGSAPPVPVAPSFTTSPSVTGTATVGATLTASTGTIAGSPTPSVSYQWEFAYDSRAWTIPAATTSTLVLGKEHAGLKVRVTVVAANPSGTASASSGWTSVVTGSGGNLFGNPGAESS